MLITPILHWLKRPDCDKIETAEPLLAFQSVEGDIMALPLDALAEEIATLDPTDQQTLWEKVAELNFQRGLEDLSRTYRARLAAEGKLDQTADAIMAELKQLREDIAAHDYRA